MSSGEPFDPAELRYGLRDGPNGAVRAAFYRSPPRDVWPCMKCGEPALPHHRGCFWAEHKQGAVQGMRYAWTPQEAKLGAVIEQMEDENEALGLRVAADAAWRRQARVLLVISGLLIGSLFSLLMMALEVSPWA